MKTKHTQGEWEVITWLSDPDDEDSLNYQVAVRDKPSGALQNFIISDCFTGCPTQEEEEANAKLIAAAPDLLKGCIMARNAIATLAENSEPAKNCLNQIDQSIKKATE